MLMLMLLLLVLMLVLVTAAQPSLATQEIPSSVTHRLFLTCDPQTPRL